jgi:hypothetical protein
LKVIGGNYYLYAAKGIWDRKKKKPVKKTVLLGSIDENGTYREKRPRRIFSSSMVYEYGNSQLVWNLAQDMYTIMEKHPYRDQIIAMAMIKAIDPMPLRLVASRFQKLYILKCFTHLWTKYEINYDPCCSLPYKWQQTWYTHLRRN